MATRTIRTNQPFLVAWSEGSAFSGLGIHQSKATVQRSKAKRLIGSPWDSNACCPWSSCHPKMILAPAQMATKILRRHVADGRLILSNYFSSFNLAAWL
jgi:hypothetical protein